MILITKKLRGCKMNKAFKTKQFIGRKTTYKKSIEFMKEQALRSCHIVVGQDTFKCIECMDNKTHCYCLAS